MMNCKKQILNALLDKYEKSKTFKEDVLYARRIMIKLYDNGDSDFRAYNIENAEVKDTYNRAVIALKSDGIVNYEWMKFESDNIIARAWLVIERVADAYAQAGRKPKLDSVMEMLAFIEVISQGVTTKWVSEYYDRVYSSIKKRRSITSALPNDVEIAHDVLRAIKMIDGFQNDEILERAFSVKCFGDSKRFERAVKKRVVGIVRKYCVDDPDGELLDEDVLRQVGIIKGPEIIEFCGSIAANFNADVVEYSPLKFGATINSFDIRNCSVQVSSVVKKVLFIENKANYTDYVLNHRNNDEVVIFHGGCYSPIKGLFFKKLYTATNKSNIGFYHWGDIDLGGFSIFCRLKKNIISELKPYNMGIKDLETYMEYQIAINGKYVEKIAQLVSVPELSDCSETLEYMIVNKVKLEQEAFIF